MPCNCCEITNDTFNEESARADIREYRKRGPARQTRMILDAVRSLDVSGIDLLDIGGGVGTIHHELLGDVAARAVHVDASSAYLKAAKEEAALRGHESNVEFIHADFTDVAGEVAVADLVTLDRVICCYPDFRSLLTQAAQHGRKAVALTYPREVWYVRMVLRVINLFQALTRNPFRVFLHPVNEMDALLVSQGFKKTAGNRIFIWEMALYQRVEG